MSTFVFFGNNLGVECQHCGAYDQTSNGHKYCTQIACPIALREYKRRKRPRSAALPVRADLPRVVPIPVAVPAAARQDDV